MASPTPVFIVGTGRCGSTMLSTLLRAHPEVLSLSEFFTLTSDLGGRIEQSFPTAPVDGPAFWRIIAGKHPKMTTAIHHDVVMDEVLYRFDACAPRFDRNHGLPAILLTTLPHLTDAPEALLDELEAFVLPLPARHIGEQYRALFSWLMKRFDKRVSVERSGGSLRIARRLIEHFPDARFVHIVRDGRGCAVSMSRHLGFRMALVAMQLTEILGVDPFESSDRSAENDLPDDLARLLPESFDRDAFLRHDTPPVLCGHYWSGEIISGLRDMAGLDPERLLTVRYEDFGEAPVETLTLLLRFIGIPVDNAWIDRHTATIKKARTIWEDLPTRELQELTAACQPGFAALGGLYP